MTLHLTLALSDMALLSGKGRGYVRDLELDCRSFRCGHFSGKCWRYVCDLELD